MAPQKSAQAAKAKHHDSKTPRKPQMNESRPRVQKPSTSDTRADRAQDTRRSEILLNYARFSNGRELEMPLDEDFEGVGALPRKGYYMRLRQLREQLNSNESRALPKSYKASAPWVPDPYDDSFPIRPSWNADGEEEEEEDHSSDSTGTSNVPQQITRMSRRSFVSPAQRRFYNKYYPLSQEFVLPEDESEEEVLPEHVIRKAPPTFMGISREIRFMIYRHLLTTKKAIAVHGGWTQVYRNSDRNNDRNNEELNLSVSILRACKVVFEEASAVLYGENTFLYRLRDPTYNVGVISNLATDDDLPSSGDVSSDEESESGSEYEDEDDEPTVNQKQSSINIAKYAPLFRRIAVEAEHNRHSRYTQESMAAAIDVFAKQGRGLYGEGACNIHTLTIRVSPTWEKLGPGQGRFTFVDFFYVDAPVIHAVKAIDCQILHVVVLTRHMSRQPSNTPIAVSGSGSFRLTVNRRHERLYNRIQREGLQRDGLDTRDKVMQHRISNMAKKSSSAIDQLASHIERQCALRNFREDDDDEEEEEDSTDDWLLSVDDVDDEDLI
ncbi:hypothetical protein TARUN_3383 [Trichoderma arundinaceum]|uniref:Uncharacterized protein n=1 Tax=Trichoderma arundinaceum TaxID=490622 RepID=A0A395NRW0_TRIAR|nr:hypothetical protein TARUN_3383 [Trichoderma arundinaceum]